MKNHLLFIVACALFAVGCVKSSDDGNDTPPNPPGSSAKLVSWRLETDRNPALERTVDMVIYGNGRIGGYLSNRAEVTSLIATFEVEHGKAYLGDRELTSGLTPLDYSEPVTIRLEGADGGEKEYIIDLVPYTGLPVVVVHTESEKPITDRENWISSTVRIDGMGKFDDLESECSVKGRGHGSWKLPKKPFNMKLESRLPVLGMKKHKRWSFLANYRDRTLLRNDVVFWLGHKADALEWTPSGEFAELILNGEYQGNFQICEQVRVDENRIDIDEMTADDNEGENLTGGYLLELDTYYDEVNKFMTPLESWPVGIKRPDEDVLTPTQFRYIQDYMIEVERLMSEGNFTKLYDEYIDLDSFVDYWLVQVLSGNTEIRAPHSVYCYKKRSGKLYAGPLWDFDLSTFVEPEGTSHKNSIWYKFLFRDPVFKARVKERFALLKDAVSTAVAPYIATRLDYLSYSAEANWRLWPIDVSLLWGRENGDEEMAVYGEAVEKMKDICLARLAWLETEVAGL